MAFNPFRNNGFSFAAGRNLIATAVAIGIGCGSVAFAANNSVQGAKKDDGGYDTDAPTAILIEASSGSVLFEKNADELRAPSSMITLMTTELVFRAVKAGDGSSRHGEDMLAPLLVERGNLAHSASLSAGGNNAPSKPGIEHLGHS